MKFDGIIIDAVTSPKRTARLFVKSMCQFHDEFRENQTFNLFLVLQQSTK